MNKAILVMGFIFLLGVVAVLGDMLYSCVRDWRRRRELRARFQRLVDAGLINPDGSLRLENRQNSTAG